MTTRLAGAPELFRLAWRRDRILVPASVLGLVALSVGSAQATLALYPDDEAAATGLAGVLTNPSVIAMYGPLASQTADALAVFKTVMMGAFLTAVLGFVVVRRHTRTEEDEGRHELVGSGVVGRWSALAASVALACLSVIAASALSAVGLAALGMDGAGSAAFAVAWLSAGLATVGVTAVAVQLASTSRGAAGLGFGFLAAAYALRAVADSSDAGTLLHALGWLSPLGWAGRVEAYGANRQWVLLLGLGALVDRGAVGVAVLDRRDLGAGLIPARSGPSRGGALLSSPAGPRHPPRPGDHHRLEHRHHPGGRWPSGRCSARSRTSPMTRSSRSSCTGSRARWARSRTSSSRRRCGSSPWRSRHPAWRCCCASWGPSDRRAR
jgi:ABC-2 type transport system permease protein